MINPRTLTGVFGVLVFLCSVLSVRADAVHADMYLEKWEYTQNHALKVLATESAETGYLYTGHFENNNGKHLGFSIAAVTRGPQATILRPQFASFAVNGVASVPEPTTIVLLSMGLAGVTAKVKRRRKKLL